MPPLNPDKLPASDLHLRDCQEIAISNLETSFKAGKPRALIQMATGAGKTYTAITAIYRLLKYVGAKRVLFLVGRTAFTGSVFGQRQHTWGALSSAATL